MYNKEKLANINRDLIDMELWNKNQLNKFKNYYFGLSYSQLEILIKELISIYGVANLDLEELVETHKNYSELAKSYNSDARVSINYFVFNNNIGLAFPYNEDFVGIVRRCGGKYNKKNNGYIVEPQDVEGILRKLEDMDADCINAREELKVILPILFKRKEVEIQNKKEQERIAEEKRLASIKFVGKSPTNDYGYFQSLQSQFANEDEIIREQIKRDRKLKIQAKIEAVKHIFSVKKD